MEKFLITGGIPLKGSVNISGAKNAAVAILPAVILSDDICRIENVPEISDVSITLRNLYEMAAPIIRLLTKTPSRLIRAISVRRSLPMI